MDYFKKVPDTTKKIPFPEPRNEPNQYKDPINPQRQTFTDKIRGAAGSVVGWAERHPSNKKSRAPRDRMDMEEPRGPRKTVSRIDRYEDGKVKETLYFSQNEPTPRYRNPKKKKRRADPLGGIGSGMRIQDFMPSNMGLGEAMGYNPSSRKRKRGDGGGSWMDPGYIPPELREFF